MHRPTWHTTCRIVEADIPLGWKPLNFEQCDGTIDPNEHLDAFLTQVNLYTNDDVILCCVFPTSLEVVALTWYGGLTPRSIDSFYTLVNASVRSTQPADLTT